LNCYSSFNGSAVAGTYTSTLVDCDYKLFGCIFASNWCAQGSTVMVFYKNFECVNCSFLNNYVERGIPFGAGGIFIEKYQEQTLENLTFFRNNHATCGGNAGAVGIVWRSGSSGDILFKNCVFFENVVGSACTSGGNDIYQPGSATTPSIDNCRSNSASPRVLFFFFIIMLIQVVINGVKEEVETPLLNWETINNNEVVVSAESGSDVWACYEGDQECRTVTFAIVCL
jgi:hypothetical protein